MNFVIPDFYPAASELFVVAMSFVVLMATAFSKNGRGAGYLLSQLTLIGAGVITLFTMDGQVAFTFSNMYVDDLLGDFLKLMVYFSVGVVLLYSRHYMNDRKMETGEYYMLALYATLGMMVMISANHFLTIYLGLELLSLSMYAMVALQRDSARATEAAMKYFVLGALASGLLLYGISMIYGATGTLEISGVAQAIYHQAFNKTVLMFGLIFVVAGLAFKLGVVPFHMWIPDVYNGAPTSIALFIASAPKLAAFAMTMRLLVNGLFELADQWQSMLMILGVMSIALGNIAAIAQTNVKRMLGYSGISHMGFMVLGLMSGVVGGDRHFALNAYSSSMFYVVAYVLMSMASFGMLILLSRAGVEVETLDDLKGLNKRNSWFAGMMSIVMFSMAGIPFFIGFFAKFSILQAVVAAGYIGIAIFAVIMSLIGAFYYLRVVKVMFFDEPVDTSAVVAPVDMRVLLSINGLAIALLGLVPDRLIAACTYALGFSL
ncbi:NADH-quinone oxidoreductase subunit NuoN [Zoogloea sp.]|uniref:NADH-quinone oxidoreductase subunit NuoN n=1 Tax=Zoogloea sp. TaxID=49181 RepID=UPI0035B3CE1E